MIGIFDSGYGGLTILQKMREQLPEYDFAYLGDNARAPYGNRSFETIHAYCLQAVHKLFDLGCPLVIFACNTASAKALRTIQQLDLPQMEDPTRRVLGIIRPSVEAIASYTHTNHVGILGTEGTILSKSYELEIDKLHQAIHVHSLACPMWVPLVENNDYDNAGAQFFIQRDLNCLLSKSKNIDTIMLACTHFPLLLPLINKYVPNSIRVVTQGDLVANSLKDYLKRHPEMDLRCTKQATTTYYTTEQAYKFDALAQQFLKTFVSSIHCTLD